MVYVLPCSFSGYIMMVYVQWIMMSEELTNGLVLMVAIFVNGRKIRLMTGDDGTRTGKLTSSA